jgi:hypothetical protein
MKYLEADIMSADQKGIDHNSGENNLYREGLEFDTVANTDVLIEAMPKTGKSPLDASILNSDKESALSS